MREAEEALTTRINGYMIPYLTCEPAQIPSPLPDGKGSRHGGGKDRTTQVYPSLGRRVDVIHIDQHHPWMLIWGRRMCSGRSHGVEGDQYGPSREDHLTHPLERGLGDRRQQGGE